MVDRKWSMADLADGEYCQTTHSVVFIEAFLILELGGVSVSPHKIIFSAAIASASLKIPPTLYVSSTLSTIIYMGFFLIFLRSFFKGELTLSSFAPNLTMESIIHY